MPTHRSLSIWIVSVEKGAARFKWLGYGTCFMMSSNSSVMVMLDAGRSLVLGKWRVSCPQLRVGEG
jgi:hypothetical protein